MRVLTEAEVDVEVAEAALSPRTGWLVEAPSEGPCEGPGGDPGASLAGPTRAVAFEAAVGPVEGYRRTVVVEPAGPGRARVRQEVEARLAIPYWGWLFAVPLRREMGRLRHRRGTPWWLPPDALDARASGALACLALLAVVTGYQAVLLAQTLTFAADQFGADTGAQGLALAVARADVVVALAFVAAADRRGRRTTLVAAGVVGCVLTALGGLAPSLWALTATQVVARGAESAAGLVLAITAAEEMPRSSRAYAVSILSVAGSLGAGIPIMGLFVADLDPSGWRVLYLLGALAVPVVLHVGRRLPESRRFRAPHAEARVAGHVSRFWLLAVSGFLFALFVTPAWQFANEYLREERGFSAARITLFTVLTNIPGGIGIVVGARLAETRGRRLVGAVAAVTSVGATVMMFLVTGWGLWAWSVAGAVLGAATVPALGVYGPELFPTAMRGRANGVLSALSRVGSVLGLVAAGFLATRLGGLGPALAVLALAPAVVAVLVVTGYPETAHLELEDINPEDRLAGHPVV